MAAEIMESIYSNDKFYDADEWTVALAKLLCRELFNRFATTFDTTVSGIILERQTEITDILRARQIAEAREAQTAPARWQKSCRRSNGEGAKRLSE
jgi:hypothetical protein